MVVDSVAGAVTFDEAIARIGAEVAPLDAETVALETAADRVLAEPVMSAFGMPRCDVAAMDGYAVDSVSMAPGGRLRVIGTAAAGQPFEQAVTPGTAVRIFTGAAMPQGADCVVMQEYAEQVGADVRFQPGYGPATHVRPAHRDFAAHQLLVPSGTVLTPHALVAAAAADLDRVKVVRRPAVALIVTGDELAAPGTAHSRPWLIPDSVSLGVAGLVRREGGGIAFRAHGRDHLPTLQGLAASALEAADLVVVTGGASVGARDFSRRMFADHALEFVFESIAMKPGKPVWLGWARGRLVLGLPGNPGSAMITARLILSVLLAALQGAGVTSRLAWKRLPLAGPLASVRGRETFLRGSWLAEGIVVPSSQDSSSQSGLPATDCLIRRLPEDGPAAAGALVNALVV